jgi:hypothetical protein
MGHVRPETIKVHRIGVDWKNGCHARRKRMTDVMTPTLKPIPLHAGTKKKKMNYNGTEGCEWEVQDARFY